MKKHTKRNALSTMAFLCAGLLAQAQCPAPTNVTANPVQICVGKTSTLNATTSSGAVKWYTVAVGGTPVATHKSYLNFTVNPVNTTTYYAEEAYVYVHNSSGPGTFTVPAGVTTVTFEAIGAQGGSFPGINGGYGGYAKGVFTVTPGDVYYTFGGSPGNSNGSPGGNGGGNGSTNGAGGGGASDVRFGGTTLNDRILVAGGGGGAVSNGAVALSGGNGGGLIGANGNGNNALSCGNFVLPTGGSQVAFGNGGTSDCANNGSNGVSGIGGSGYTNNAGGGGGGYYGGGGGHENMSGAGGSNYVAPSAISFSHAQAYNGGWGSVRIYYECITALRTPVTVSVNPNPTVTANSGTICSGNSFVIVPSGAATYTYSGGSATVSPFSNTSYTVTGTDAEGCSSSAISSVSVDASPTITVNSGAICSGESFTINPAGADTYTISGGTATVSPIANTSYTITGTNLNGCVSQVAAISDVTVNAIPTITVNSGVMCEGDIFLLVPGGGVTYTSSGGDFTVSPHSSTTYSVWGTSAEGCLGTAVSDITVHTLPSVVVNSGSICVGESFVIVPSGAITYTISGGSATVTPLNTTSYSITGSNAEGCVGMAISDVTVHALPAVIISGTTAICKGNSATLTVSGANTYSWSTAATTSSISVTPTLTSTYSVSGTDANGCTSYAMETITVFTLPSVVVTGPSSVCAGSQAILLASGANTYSWSTNSTTASMSVTPAQTSTYSVTGTDGNGCKDAATHTVVVNALPVLTVTSTYSMICAGNTTSLTVSGGSLYTWSTNETTSEISITPTISTSYTVATVDGNNCASKAVYTQSVSECTGITNLSSAQKAIVSVYPNPNNGSFSISSDSELTLSLINELGQVISTLALNNLNDYKAAVTDLPAGIYFAVGTTGSQAVTHKIIVAH